MALFGGITVLRLYIAFWQQNTREIYLVLLWGINTIEMQ